MLPAVAAAVSASETAAVTWALKARAVARNVSAACCVFLPTVDVVVFRFCCFAFLPFLQLFGCGGKRWRRLFYCLCCFSLHSFSCCFCCCSIWLKGKASTLKHENTHTRRQAQKFQQLNHSFILFYISFVICVLCTYISFLSTVCILMKLNKNT